LLGSAHPNIAPYDKFACSDGDVFLGILNDRQFQRFCEHVGLPTLAADIRFASNSVRLQHRDQLRVEIAAALAPLPREPLCQGLMRQGVPIGTVNTVPQAFRQAHAEHRQMRVEGDGYRGIGVPTKLSRTPGRPGGPPPSFGQHADEVLLQAGLGRSRIAELRECGVLKQ
jgi:crotonobetainyl-CoA:carnitine CoA-transferase CaiB-like acyl-CoA transferase